MPDLSFAAADVMDLVERIASVAIILTALEMLLARAELRRGGALDWRLLSLKPPAGRLDRAVRHDRFRPLLDYPGVTLIAVVDLAAAALILVAPRLFVGPLLAMVLHVILSKRNHQSVDGSDDMLMVILGASVIRGLSPEEVVQYAAVLFVAGQSMLSYLTSGVSKSQSQTWWSGSGLRGTLTTMTYSEPHVARVIARWPLITRFLGPFTIAWESTFALWILAGPVPALVAIAIAAAFHLACGSVMGLAAFTFTFGAALPAVLATSVWIASAVPLETRLLLVLFAAIPLVAGMGFFAGEARHTGR